jgi:hypothetical protein
MKTYSLDQLRGAFGAGGAWKIKDRKCGMCRHFSFAFCLREEHRMPSGDCMIVEASTDARGCRLFNSPNAANQAEARQRR